MQTAGRLDDAAHLAGLQAKGRDLELLLHVALAEVAQVAALAGGRAVGLGEGELAEGDAAGVDLGLVGLDDGEGLVFRARDLGLLSNSFVSSHIVFLFTLGSHTPGCGSHRRHRVRFAPKRGVRSGLPRASWTAAASRGA